MLRQGAFLAPFGWVQRVIAIAVLAVVVSFGAALPAYARLLSGPKAHVCHCDTGRGHAHCECPICFGTQDPDVGGALTVAIKGQCGDDDTGWRVFSGPAVLPPSLIHDVRFEALAVPVSTPERPPQRVEPPDPRPPRPCSSSCLVGLVHA